MAHRGRTWANRSAASGSRRRTAFSSGTSSGPPSRTTSRSRPGKSAACVRSILAVPNIAWTRGDIRSGSSTTVPANSRNEEARSVGPFGGVEAGERGRRLPRATLRGKEHRRGGPSDRRTVEEITTSRGQEKAERRAQGRSGRPARDSRHLVDPVEATAVREVKDREPAVAVVAAEARRTTVVRPEAETLPASEEVVSRKRRGAEQTAVDHGYPEVVRRRAAVAGRWGAAREMAERGVEELASRGPAEAHPDADPRHSEPPLAAAGSGKWRFDRCFGRAHRLGQALEEQIRTSQGCVGPPRATFGHRAARHRGWDRSGEGLGGP